MTPYIDVADAKDYFKSRVDISAWECKDDATRLRALNQATRIIDQLPIMGTKASDTQDTQFPRYPDVDVPTAIKDATCEIAYALLDGINPELEFENLTQTSSGYANIKSTFDRTSESAHILAGVPSVTAWRMLLPYLADNHSIVMRRVS